MHARSTTFRGRPEMVDRAIALVTEEVYPAVREMPGCVGMSFLADRESGRCIATTAWESEDQMRASDPAVAPLRDRAAGVLGAGPEIRHWEIAVLHRERRAGDGACARVTWTQADPVQGDRNVAIFRDGVLPHLQDLPGFCSTSLLIDRSTGAAALATVYESREALEDSRQAAMGLRNDATARMSAEILEVAEFEVVMAHLRVPETV